MNHGRAAPSRSAVRLPCSGGLFQLFQLFQYFRKLPNTDSFRSMKFFKVLEQLAQDERNLLKYRSIFCSG